MCVGWGVGNSDSLGQHNSQREGNAKAPTLQMEKELPSMHPCTLLQLWCLWMYVFQHRPAGSRRRRGLHHPSKATPLGRHDCLHQTHLHTPLPIPLPEHLGCHVRRGAPGLRRHCTPATARGQGHGSQGKPKVADLGRHGQGPVRLDAGDTQHLPGEWWRGGRGCASSTCVGESHTEGAHEVVAETRGVGEGWRKPCNMSSDCKLESRTA